MIKICEILDSLVFLFLKKKKDENLHLFSVHRWRSGNHMWELVLLFHHVDPGDKSKIMSSGLASCAPL